MRSQFNCTIVTGGVQSNLCGSLIAFVRNFALVGTMPGINGNLNKRELNEHEVDTSHQSEILHTGQYKHA